MSRDETEAVKALYRRYWACMIAKDADGLRRLMTDDYCLMHMTGVRQSREEFLRGLLNGTFNYYSAEHDGVEAHVCGDSAEMTGKSCVEAAVYGGRRSAWRLRGDFTLRKEQGVWKLASSCASTY